MKKKADIFKGTSQKEVRDYVNSMGKGQKKIQTLDDVKLKTTAFTLPDKLFNIDHFRS